MGVEVLSMSVDSMFVHKMWDENELAKMVDGGVPFPMLSDSGGRVGTAYGIYDDNAGVETRGRFIIDPDGVVQGYEVLTPPVGRNVISVGARKQGQRSHTFRLATRQTNSQARTRPCRKGLGSLANRAGL